MDNDLDELEDQMNLHRKAAKLAIEDLDFHTASQLEDDARKIQEEIKRRKRDAKGTVQPAGE